jgi:hypothetical protein
MQKAVVISNRRGSQLLTKDSPILEEEDHDRPRLRPREGKTERSVVDEKANLG